LRRHAGPLQHGLQPRGQIRTIRHAKRIGDEPIEDLPSVVRVAKETAIERVEPPPVQSQRDEAGDRPYRKHERARTGEHRRNGAITVSDHDCDESTEGNDRRGEDCVARERLLQRGAQGNAHVHNVIEEDRVRCEERHDSQRPEKKPPEPGLDGRSMLERVLRRNRFERDGDHQR
jgi:hypothetical protein